MATEVLVLWSAELRSKWLERNGSRRGWKIVRRTIKRSCSCSMDLFMSPQVGVHKICIISVSPQGLTQDLHEALESPQGCLPKIRMRPQDSSKAQYQICMRPSVSPQG